MQTIRHIACGQVAFTYDGDVRVGPLSAELAHFPDGTQPKRGTPITCGSCGRPIFGNPSKSLTIDELETENV